MNRIFSLLAGLLLLFSFSACRSDREPESALTGEVRDLQNLNRDVTLEMELVAATSEKVEVHVNLRNPSAQKLESVRSWVSFPAHILQGAEISFPENTALGLIAPGENDFDNVAGLARIGVSFTSDSVPQETMTVATLTFDRSRNEPALLTFFDYRNEGHAQVLVMHNGKLRNVLAEEAPEPFGIEPVE